MFPGKRMSGHMGVMRRTIENLTVVEIDVARNLLLISGAVPGSEGGEVIVRPSVKAARLAEAQEHRAEQEGRRQESRTARSKA